MSEAERPEAALAPRQELLQRRLAARGAPARGGRSRSRSSPITYSSSDEASIAIRCSGEATRPSSSLIASIASGVGSAPGLWISAASLTSSRYRATAALTSSTVSSRISEIADAGLPRRLEHLVAEHPVGRVQALGGPEQLLLVDLLLAAGRLARGAVDARRRGLALLGALRPREHQRQAGAGHRHVGEHQPPLGGQRVAGLGQRLGDQLVGDPARPPSGARRPRRCAGRAGRRGRTRAP